MLDAARQLRFHPDGRVLGLELAATLSLAAARGLDHTATGHLLPAAEAGLIAGLSPAAARNAAADDPEDTRDAW